MKFIKDLFKRYDSGTISQEEKLFINKWYDAVDHLPLPKWITPDRINEDRVVAWKEVCRQLEFTETPAIRISSARIQRRLIAVFGYAAIVIVMLGVGFLLFNWHQSRVNHGFEKAYYSTSVKEQRKLVLPDGSVVTMNSGSSVAFVLKQFNNTNREIWLDEGEAFFEVKKNPHKPFIVHFGRLQTRVLGTSFNIEAYKAMGKSMVTVKEGRVRVSEGKMVLDTLIANQMLVYQASNSLYVTSTANTRETTGWMEGRLILDKAKLNELKLKLNLHFGIKLMANSEKLEQAMFTASFNKGADLYQVLDVLCSLYGVHYKYKNGEVTLYE